MTDTITIALDALSADARAKIMARLESHKEGEEGHGYYTKAIDRLKDETAFGKITLPVDVFTKSVLAAIDGKVKDLKGEAKARKAEVHPHVDQTVDRLKHLKR